MAGQFSGFNNDSNAINFNKKPDMFPDPYGYIKGVGCAGTNSGIVASKSEYAEPPLVGASLVGGDGYSFTNERIPIASPSAPYSIIERYNDSNRNYRNDFPKSFPSALSGGRKKHSKRHSKRHSIRHSKRHSMRRSRSMRKHTQYGCSKKHKHGGRKHTRRSSRRSNKHKSRRGGAVHLARRGGRKTMRGGMSDKADYTQGRNTSQDIPYGNEAYSFGQGLDSMLSSGESALASPPPFLPYNDCGKVMRN